MDHIIWPESDWQTLCHKLASNLTPLYAANAFFGDAQLIYLQILQYHHVCLTTSPGLYHMLYMA